MVRLYIVGDRSAKVNWFWEILIVLDRQLFKPRVWYHPALGAMFLFNKQKRRHWWNLFAFLYLYLLLFDLHLLLSRWFNFSLNLNQACLRCIFNCPKFWRVLRSQRNRYIARGGWWNLKIERRQFANWPWSECLHIIVSSWLIVNNSLSISRSCLNLNYFLLCRAPNLIWFLLCTFVWRLYIFEK